MKKNDQITKISEYLPPQVARSLNMLSIDLKTSIREIKLRTNQPIVLKLCDGTCFLGDYGRVNQLSSKDSIVMTYKMMNDTFLSMCNDCVYTYMDNVRSGFLTLNGGNRVGISGRCVSTNLQKKSIRDVNSLSIRIAREYMGLSEPLMGIYARFGLGNTLVFGAPCSGKTTLLRDICRNISNGNLDYNYTVSLIDERGEIAAVCDEIPTFEIGNNTDIYTNYEKSDAIHMSVRTMSPDVIIFDEVGEMSEILSMKEGMNSGVNFIFSIHAGNYEELCSKGQFEALKNSISIKYLVFLERYEPGKIKEVLMQDEDGGFSACFNSFCQHRSDKSLKAI